jgi:hypothetical protein
MGGQSFKVEPRYLVGYADQLQRQAQIFEEMRAHMDKYGHDVHGLEGMLQQFADMCVALADWQVRILRDMHGKMNSTAAALKATATDYQEADASGAVDMEEIDKKLPDGRADGPSGRYELRDEPRGAVNA